MLAPKAISPACWGGAGYSEAAVKTGCFVVVDENVSRSIAKAAFGTRCLVSGGVSTISENVDNNYLVYYKFLH